MGSILRTYAPALGIGAADIDSRIAVCSAGFCTLAGAEKQPTECIIGAVGKRYLEKRSSFLGRRYRLG